jgi:hypothetical protein
VAIHPCFPPLLSFLDRLLAIATTVISAPAVVITKFLSNGLLNNFFAALSASGHCIALPFFTQANPIDYHRKRNLSIVKLTELTGIIEEMLKKGIQKPVLRSKYLAYYLMIPI